MKKTFTPFNQRLNRPPTQKLPDPAAWEAKHGTKPYLLDGPKIEPFVQRAEELNTADWETLDQSEVHRIHGEMDCVCEAVGGQFRLTDSIMVFFDPEKKVFWAYPYTTE